MRIPIYCAVRLIDLPYSVGAMLSVDDDGFTSIYINARLSRTKQRSCLKHELRHIQGDDAFNARRIQDVEVDE